MPALLSSLDHTASTGMKQGRILALLRKAGKATEGMLRRAGKNLGDA